MLVVGLVIVVAAAMVAAVPAVAESLIVFSGANILKLFTLPLS